MRQDTPQERDIRSFIQDAIGRQWKMVMGLISAVILSGGAVYTLALPSILQTAREKWQADDAKLAIQIQQSVDERLGAITTRLEDLRSNQASNTASLQRLLERVK